MEDSLKNEILKELKKSGGLLRLNPTLVARQFASKGTRLGLPDDVLDAGDRGFVCERWLGSESSTQFTGNNEGEGLSTLNAGEQEIQLKEAVTLCPGEIMGEEYAGSHSSLGKLAKLYDYSGRIFCHYHQMSEDAAKIGMKSKDEAYYFPEGADLGEAPVAYFGCHSYIVDENRQKEIFLPYVRDWKGSDITRHMKGFLTVCGDGFHLPSGILHSPSSALTLELQEPSDVWAVLEPEVDGSPMDKELLFRSVSDKDRADRGDEIFLDQVDWEACSDPWFYENHHTPPVLLWENREGREEWIYYNSTRFSGKRLLVKPGQTCHSNDAGVYNLFVWKGKGRAGDLSLQAGQPGKDEILVCHDAAVKGVNISNTGSETLEIFKFFGPDINNDILPFLPGKS